MPQKQEDLRGSIMKMLHLSECVMEERFILMCLMYLFKGK